ncbi:PHP domain-containing protein [Desulfotruncus alcoholivorax]|uniref:PHP domain-containing protein n=1 Tax=Desulfotruncus alcoholivorax TaxID=265477 RepID=UPI000480C4DD|nr:PHP domain-containing protein [Desulfotruncus alcoholivorax]
MFADLHVHTNVSDGASSPVEVVQYAARINLRCIAITDHDTMDGIDAARVEAQLNGVDLLSGVELSTECEGMEVHILGYCINPENSKFKKHLIAFQDARLTRAYKIINKLRDLDINIDIHQVLALAGKGSVGRPHIAKVLLAEGKVSSVAEAFEKYIGVGKPAYEPRMKYHPLEVIGLIKQAGGVPVLAHPGISCDDKLVMRLIEGGVQGIEVYHPQHNRDMEKMYLKICREHRLIVSGGSDFHGLGATNHGKLGESVVPYETVAEIRHTASKNRAAL